MTSSRVLLPVLLSGLACLLVAPVAGPGSGGPAVASDRVAALAVLREWDRARAAAWRSGDPSRLAGLYTARARAGRADRALLAAYAARGLRVAGMRMQVADVEVVTVSSRRVVLVVTDRLVGATAVARRTRIPLPRDGWSRRRVVLERAGAAWRVAEVTGQPWSASTAAASGSANSKPAS